MKRFLGFLAIPVVVLFAGLAWAETYEIDADHSSVQFKIRHLGISSVSGTFATFQGTFDYDPANVAASSTRATIKVASIDTAQTKRDNHLRSADFFDEAKFPEITFVSKQVSDVSGKNFKVAGDLTIHGITKPVVLDVEFGGAAKDPWGNERAAFIATTEINRKDFGLTWNKVLETGGLVVGDEVKIVLEVEGVRKAKSA